MRISLPERLFDCHRGSCGIVVLVQKHSALSRFSWCEAGYFRTDISVCVSYFNAPVAMTFAILSIAWQER
ncbi:hypothetical protein GWL_39570 [Herbaspirillum sp. GW103]|nr:hypothetical protein GWL_39570 [Herbaspirillum sp. GW103]